MSIDRFVNNLRAQLSELKAARAAATERGEKSRLTRAINDATKAFNKATSRGVTL